MLDINESDFEANLGIKVHHMAMVHWLHRWRVEQKKLNLLEFRNPKHIGVLLTSNAPQYLVPNSERRK